MFRTVSLIVTYLLTNMLFRDLIRKFAGPYITSTTQGMVRFVLKATLFIFVGAALMTAGLILSANEGARVYADSPYFYFTPALVVNLALFLIGIVLIGIPAFTNFLVPRSMRVSNRQQEAPLLDMMTAIIHSITREMERRQTQPEPPASRSTSTNNYNVGRESDKPIENSTVGTVH